MVTLTPGPRPSARPSVSWRGEGPDAASAGGQQIAPIARTAAIS